MKRIVKAIAFLLATVILASCFTCSAFADGEKSVRQYGKEGGYIAFGDSVARGVGATPGNYKETHNFYDRTVNGSYPYLVAQAIGCNIKDNAKDADSNYWPICFHSMTLALAMDLLGIDDGYYDDVFAHGTSSESFHYYDIMQELYGDAAQKLEDASLISIGLGMSDVFYRALTAAKMGGGEINADFIETLLSNIYEGYNYWLKAYPMLLEYIKTVNPEAEVVIVGNYDVGGDMLLAEDIFIPVGKAATVIIGYMNTYLKQWAKEYGYIYCDITNAEILGAEEDIELSKAFSDLSGELLHLSPSGNALVARSIINSLPDENNSQREVSTDIVVDLGRFKSVSYVTVDGKLLSKQDYSMNGYELTIPCKHTLAKNLTVAICNESGKTSLYTYQLQYHEDTGYCSYLIVGVNDTGRVVESAASNAKKLANSVSELLKGKFTR